MSLQLFGLLISLLVETPVVLAVPRLLHWASHRQRLWLLAPGVTLLTHPLAWGVNMELIHLSPLLRLPAIELAVVAIEGLILGLLGGLGIRRGAALSLTANASSFLLGLVML